MARDVDTVIEFIKNQSYIPPIHRQVMANRLENPPTQEELDKARNDLYPNIKNLDPWKVTDGQT